MSASESKRKRAGNPPSTQPKKSSRKWIVIAAIFILVIVVATGAFIALRNSSPTNQNTPPPAGNPVAVINTSMGVIRVELYTNQAPITTANFIKLVNDGFYTGLVFHRVANLDSSAPTTHIIQGGGFYANGTNKVSPYGPITLETKPDLLHDDGAIAMARTNDQNSATSQFYICDGPEHFLDGNYAVFGKVADNSSLTVVRAIANVQTTTKTIQGQSMSNWPVSDIIINSITMENQ